MLLAQRELQGGMRCHQDCSLLAFYVQWTPSWAFQTAERRGGGVSGKQLTASAGVTGGGCSSLVGKQSPPERPPWCLCEEAASYPVPALWVHRPLPPTPSSSAVLLVVEFSVLWPDQQPTIASSTTVCCPFGVAGEDGGRAETLEARLWHLEVVHPVVRCWASTLPHVGVTHGPLLGLQPADKSGLTVEPAYASTARLLPSSCMRLASPT